MDKIEMINVLLSWTVYLSSYSLPETPPSLEYKPQSFFVEHACLGNEKCRVAGWYDDHGTIFIDDRTESNNDAMTRSLIVHEIAHYLQDISGKFDVESCENHLVREREAYSIQRQYLNKIAGRFVAIYINYLPCPDGQAGAILDAP